jgi:hypothetical protein
MPDDLAKRHAGFRFKPDLMTALDAAAEAYDMTRTDIVDHWLRERAIAEGWLEPIKKMKVVNAGVDDVE